MIAAEAALRLRIGSLEIDLALFGFLVLAIIMNRIVGYGEHRRRGRNVKERETEGRL